jgi:hypothetical protein
VYSTRNKNIFEMDLKYRSNITWNNKHPTTDSILSIFKLLNHPKWIDTHLKHFIVMLNLYSLTIAGFILCELTLFWYLLLKWVALFKKQLKIHRFSVDVCTTHLTRPRPSNQLLSYISLVHNEIGSTIFEFCQLNQ